MKQAATIAAGLLFVLAGCGDRTPSTAPRPASGTAASSAAACTPEIKEALDPGSGRHVLPGGLPPHYVTDPPTSGPHTPGPKISGVLTDPLPRLSQVGALEAGTVLLQHRDLTTDERAALDALSSDGVAVVPNPDLPARVVATAWLTKQTCTSVDVAALRTFVDAHVGHGPG
ncbi:MAG: hypothetical protein QOC92_4062 [Acidimicrobiaceae bacterium]|jgi:hypothetical protein